MTRNQLNILWAKLVEAGVEEGDLEHIILMNMWQENQALLKYKSDKRWEEDGRNGYIQGGR